MFLYETRGVVIVEGMIHSAAALVCSFNVSFMSYLLTPWSRVLLEKLTGSAASQEIPRTLWNP